jgi:hypothetical protein
MRLARLTPALYVLSLLIGLVLLMPSRAGAADWISGTESYAATWVTDVERELFKEEYRAVFLNDPRTPQISVLKLLNNAALAYEAKNPVLAEGFVREALEVIQEGVRKHYFSQSDVDPIISFIKQAVPVKL